MILSGAALDALIAKALARLAVYVTQGRIFRPPVPRQKCL
jgi:hypothetical protein